jgi:hypothetical protein
MAFSVTIPAGFDQWDRQVHCFIRGGIYVPRLIDSVTGPSNNVVDLLLYLLRNSSRVPEAQIDTANLLAAATFTNANGFWFNGVVSESTNLRDWISNTLKYFLLRQARIGGKEALKPLVPINNDGTIKTTAVSWVFTFTEQHIIPDSFEITYSPLADRKPFCATVLWRQQDDLGIPVMRTAEVRYTGTAVDGPFEQHDLSDFCSSENHAVKVGAYVISKRKHITHRLQLGVKPDAFNPTLAAGDLVRVRLERIASTGANSLHDYLYEVDRIGKSITGEVQLDLTHFPVDSNLASVVAQEVNSATGTGLLLPTGLSGVTCDINSSGDTSVPAESFTGGSFPNYGSSLDGLSESGLGDPGVSNPAESSFSPPALTSDGDINNPAVGDTLTAPVICDGGEVVFYRIDPSVPGGKVIAAQATSTYTLVINDVDKSVYSEIRCPDPTSPTGYGEPINTISTAPVQKPCTSLPGQTSAGTVSPTGTTTVSWTGITWTYKDIFGSTCASTFDTGSFGASSAVITGGIGSMVLQKPDGAGGWITGVNAGYCGGIGSEIRVAWLRPNGTVGSAGFQYSAGGGADLFSVVYSGLTYTSTEPDAVAASTYFGDCT